MIKHKIEIKRSDLRADAFIGRLIKINELPQGKSGYMVMDCVVSDNYENVVNTLKKKYPFASISDESYIIPWPNTLDE